MSTTSVNIPNHALRVDVHLMREIYDFVKEEGMYHDDILWRYTPYVIQINYTSPGPIGGTRCINERNIKSIAQIIEKGYAISTFGGNIILDDTMFSRYLMIKDWCIKREEQIRESWELVA